MEHLPLPRNPTIGKIEIPFLCTEEYDGGAFKSYPARCGWAIELRPVVLIRFYRQGQVVTDSKEIGDFLQRWLYLGLVSEIVGLPAKLAMFKRENENGGVIFSSQCLGHLMKVWSTQILEHADWSESGSNNIQAWKIHVHSCVEQMGNVVQWVVRTQDDHPDSDLSRICLSLAVLGEAVTYAMKGILMERHLLPPKRFSWRFPSPCDCGRPIIERMKQNGWCPNRLAYFDNEVTNLVGMLWYYANMDAPKVADNHKNCTPDRCMSLQIDEREYQTAHVDKTCNCGTAGPHPDQLADVVTSGSVPLVTVSERDDGKREVSLLTAEADTEFVAISHVWADGFGNPSDNALQCCTIEYIQDIVNYLPRDDRSKSVPFWMDTMCLPVGPKETRKLALQNLNEPYKRAKYVIVFDSYLRELDVYGMAASEIMARIVVSGWHQRLWTFAEGRIAQRIAFAFKTGVVDLVTALKPWVESMKRIPSNPANDVYYAICLSYTATHFTADLDGSGMDVKRIQSLRTGLSTRATSRALDEALCLGVILGLDLKLIVEAQDAEKMCMVWSMMRKIPIGLAFSHASRKLDSQGYRWAPASLMGDTNKQLWGGPTTLFTRLEADPCDKGLQFAIRGVFFKNSTTNLTVDTAHIAKKRLSDICQPQNPKFGPWDLWLREPNGNWFVVSIDEAWHHNINPISAEDEEPAIILADTFSKAFTDDDRPDKMYGKNMVGLLVTYLKPKIGQPSSTTSTTHARVHRHVQMQVISKQESAQLNTLKSCADELLANTALTDEIALLRNRPLNLTQHPPWLRQAVDEHAQRDDGKLLQSGRETQAYRMLRSGDEDVLKLYYAQVAYFVVIDAWIEIEESAEDVKWCVD